MLLNITFAHHILCVYAPFRPLLLAVLSELVGSFNMKLRSRWSFVITYYFRLITVGRVGSIQHQNYDPYVFLGYLLFHSVPY